MAEQRRYHPLIEALAYYLPPQGMPWSEDKQRRWLAAMEASVRLLYDLAPSPPSVRRRHPIGNIEPPY